MPMSSGSFSRREIRKIYGSKTINTTELILNIALLLKGF